LKRQPKISRAREVPCEERNAFVTEIIEAATKDYKLNELASPEEVALLYKAFLIQPLKINTGFFDNLSKADILKIEAFLDDHFDQVQAIGSVQLVLREASDIRVDIYDFPSVIPGMPLIFAWARQGYRSLELYISSRFLRIILEAYFIDQVVFEGDSTIIEKKTFDSDEFFAVFAALACHEVSRINGLGHKEAVEEQRGAANYRLIGKELEEIQETVYFMGKLDSSDCAIAESAARALGERSNEEWAS
jgi:hypothetical protein